MFKVELTYEVTVDKAMPPTATITKLKAIESQTLGLLQAIPGPVKYPIRWTTERQRRAFFATNGFGKGIPTKRTGAVAKAWVFNIEEKGLSRFQEFTRAVILLLAHIDPTKKLQQLAPIGSEIIVTIDNPVYYERYVTGIQQQGFHKDTGWIYTPPVIENAVQQIEDVLETGFLGV